MTIEYEDFVAWSKKTNTELNITRTQYLFAEKVLSDNELCRMLSSPGDLVSIMEKIQQYLKN